MIILDCIIIILIWIIGNNFRNRFPILSQYDKKILRNLFYYHLFFGIVFFAYVSKFGGDSTNYWFVTYFSDFTFKDVLFLMQSGSATGYMMIINYIPAKVLGISFFTGTIMYSLLGYMGFVFFYLTLKQQVPNWNKLLKTKVFGVFIFPFFLFLPNMHFWTSGIGKDTLMFFSIGMFAYSIQKIGRRFIGIIIPIAITFLIRPHITLFMVSAFGMGFFFDGKRKLYQKVIMVIVAFVGFGLLLSKVQEFANIESFETDTIVAYSEKSSSNLSAGRIGSAVNISNYPLPLKIFTFLYRPLFFDGLSPLNFISSIENLFVLFFTIKVFRNSPFKKFASANFVFKGYLLLFVMGSIAFSLILGNLGIMMRQKTPFIATLLFYGFYVLSGNYVGKKINTKRA